MKYFFYAIFILSLTFQSFFAQNQIKVIENSPCKLPIEKSPKLQGFKLGMAPQEIEQSLGRKISPFEVNSYFDKLVNPMANMSHIRLTTNNPIGQSEFHYFPNSTSKFPQGRNQLGGFHLVFIDNILAEYVIYYDIKDFDFGKSEGISTVVAKKLNLPNEFRWTYDSFLTCNGFRITVGNYDNQVIQISVVDLKLQSEFRMRAEKAVTDQEKQSQQ
jgi:hypothetical protein